ncbi:argininosuccinate lyase [Thermithiobacillus plumbiphilus]|uniref:Argininosuccinate lyase n=1 Tax=Thermithiobacillus plumbiphilus TaxID=1729899 RepID=A0ABU9D8A7_9PROT
MTGDQKSSPTAGSAETSKPWTGRFTAPTDAFVEAFTASIDFDKRLYAQDIRGSMAHARMLGQVGVLSPQEAEQITVGLAQVQAEIEAGQMRFQMSLEDIHMHVETRLTELIGDVGKKLHTGRSRNDQVATDVRLYTRESIDAILAGIVRLEQALLGLAEREADTILPGFTHLQVAQPVTFGHHLLAYFEMLHRDAQRLVDTRRRVNVLPLGAAALAGTTFPIDREFVARELGFEAVAENSLDAVSDRDFAIETVFALSLLMVHLSRFAEELILWSSPQFGFIELSDSFCTGSSIMPQKKNPDVPELVRGKSARVIGALQTLLVLMKGQPLAYNKDNQEDKEPLFDALDTARGSLKVFAEMLPEMTVRRENMRAAALKGFATATDLADYLVRKGLPFRAAHEVVGKAVRHAIEAGCNLEDLPLETLRGFSPLIEADVQDVLTLEGSVNARNHIGGTAPAQVRAAIDRARQRLAGLEA